MRGCALETSGSSSGKEEGHVPPVGSLGDCNWTWVAVPDAFPWPCPARPGVRQSPWRRGRVLKGPGRSVRPHVVGGGCPTRGRHRASSSLLPPQPALPWAPTPPASLPGCPFTRAASRPLPRAGWGQGSHATTLLSASLALTSPRPCPSRLGHFGLVT